jgi:hypothetical protein
MLNNKFLIIIIIAIVLVVSIGVTVALVIINKDDTPKPSDKIDAPIISDTPITPDNPIRIPVFLGNTELSEERAALLDIGILEEIERLKTGVPKEDGNGNYLTDENGKLIYESSFVVDYPDMETNLAVIINHFADKGYSDEAIIQIQRYYFHFARSFARFSTEELFEKIALCFPAEGTTPEALTLKAEEVFGQIRDDGFRFVFEAPDRIADVQVVFCDVVAWGNITLIEERKVMCIYDTIYSGNECERNLEGWLHKIINEMCDLGYGEKELVIAQLLYSGSLAETEYRYDLVKAIRTCIPSEKETTIEELNTSVQEIFGVIIEDNIALIDYLEGATAYEKKVDV